MGWLTNQKVKTVTRLDQVRSMANGLKASWSVPAWFVSILVAIGLGFLSWITAATIWNTSKLQQGDRLTANHGAALEVRLKALEDLEVPPPWFEQRVFKLELRVEKMSHNLQDVLLAVREDKKNNQP